MDNYEVTSGTTLSSNDLSFEVGSGWGNWKVDCGLPILFQLEPRIMEKVDVVDPPWCRRDRARPKFWRSVMKTTWRVTDDSNEGAFRDDHWRYKEISPRYQIEIQGREIVENGINTIRGSSLCGDVDVVRWTMAQMTEVQRSRYSYLIGHKEPCAPCVCLRKRI